MLVNQSTQYNNSFMGATSFKPICGHFLRDAYVNKLVQAVVKPDILLPAQPIIVKNSSTTIGSNVLTIESLATTDAAMSGFSLASPGDFLFPGDQAPAARKGQITYIALFGSGIELYLPCDSTVNNIEIQETTGFNITYDFTDNVLKKAADSTNNIPVKLLSSVVDGVTFELDTTSNNVKIKDTKCIKVQL